MEASNRSKNIAELCSNNVRTSLKIALQKFRDLFDGTTRKPSPIRYTMYSIFTSNIPIMSDSFELHTFIIKKKSKEIPFEDEKENFIL